VASAEFDEEGLRDPSGPGFTIAPTLVSVASRGEIRLRDGDPRHAPLIDPRYFDEPEDLDAMVEGLRITLDMVGQKPLRPYLVEQIQPRGELRTEDDLREHSRRRVQTLYHPVGTAAMGTGETAVVDLELRVKGLSGLRVVDASVMPTVTRGNTNAPTIAVAERAADLIRGR
jgi:choline dehydrogenase